MSDEDQSNYVVIYLDNDAWQSIWFNLPWIINDKQIGHVWNEHKWHNKGTQLNWQTFTSWRIDRDQKSYLLPMQPYFFGRTNEAIKLFLENNFKSFEIAAALLTEKMLIRSNQPAI